jgi:hypothetical protein
MMAAAKRSIEDEIATFARRTKAERAAEDRLGFVAVAMIGYERPVPVEFKASNLAIWPCRLVATKEPRNVHKKPDTEAPIVPIKVWNYVWTRTDFHAKRLKDRMEALLLGESDEAQALRHSWIDVEEPEIVWGLLLPRALKEIRAREKEFNVWSEHEYRALVRNAVSGRIA